MKEATNRLNNNGRIVNISSGLVVRPMPGFSLYCGSKAAIELMGKVLSMELGDRSITVNTVSPGPTETEMFANSGDDAKAAAERSPFNRLGEPEDIADVGSICCQREMLHSLQEKPFKQAAATFKNSSSTLYKTL